MSGPPSISAMADTRIAPQSLARYSCQAHAFGEKIAVFLTAEGIIFEWKDDDDVLGDCQRTPKQQN